MKKLLSIFALVFLALPFAALALPSDAPVSLPAAVMNDTNDLFALIRIVLNWLFYVLLILAVLYMLFIAIHYITAGGKDPKAVADNGKKLGWILVGIVVALVAKGLIYLTCYLVTGGQTCKF